MLNERVRAEIEMFKRHIIVLRAVIEEGPIGILRLSEITSLPTHKVRYSLRILEREHLIVPSPQGAVPTGRGIRVMEKIEDEIRPIEEKLTELKRYADPNRAD
ncbi:MAG: hypothetical protein SBU_000159 [Candidatus Syntrophoarchaeum butanivorans]|uniref:Winged helix-turn-helix transcriptional regulator n=1 Tax=Candidatus Syntropharchaeum butanivorans TaxID=1839936 RepID=A0A1F2P8C9_9EURY|nr:MAG: hypothetical protein SBU_000159 [Candidatus Syntrophoarchaeum butanivorans]